MGPSNGNDLSVLGLSEADLSGANAPVAPAKVPSTVSTTPVVVAPAPAVLPATRPLSVSDLSTTSGVTLMGDTKLMAGMAPVESGAIKPKNSFSLMKISAEVIIGLIVIGVILAKIGVIQSIARSFLPKTSGTLHTILASIARTGSLMRIKNKESKVRVYASAGPVRPHQAFRGDFLGVSPLLDLYNFVSLTPFLYSLADKQVVRLVDWDMNGDFEVEFDGKGSGLLSKDRYVLLDVVIDQSTGDEFLEFVRLVDNFPVTLFRVPTTAELRDATGLAGPEDDLQ